MGGRQCLINPNAVCGDRCRMMIRFAFGTTQYLQAAKAKRNAEINGLLRVPMYKHVARSTTGKKYEVVGNPSVGTQACELLFINIFDDLNRLMRFLGKRRDDIGVNRILRDFFVVKGYLVEHAALHLHFIFIADKGCRATFTSFAFFDRTRGRRIIGASIARIAHETKSF